MHKKRAEKEKGKGLIAHCSLGSGFAIEPMAYAFIQLAIAIVPHRVSPQNVRQPNQRRVVASAIFELPVLFGLELN